MSTMKTIKLIRATTKDIEANTTKRISTIGLHPLSED